MEESIPTVSKIKADLAEKAALAERLKQELTQSQTYLAEAMRRMRDGSEETVDRRVIANLLITYILSPRGDKTRYEMLSVIANILKISDEEKYKIGVANKPPQSTIKDTTISADASIGVICKNEKNSRLFNNRLTFYFML